MEETKPTGLVRARTYAEFMALKADPIPCAWDGCEEKSKKHCCGFTEPEKGCRAKRLAYCTHHFYRHLMREHPREAKNRGCDDVKKLL